MSKRWPCGEILCVSLAKQRAWNSRGRVVYDIDPSSFPKKPANTALKSSRHHRRRFVGEFRNRNKHLPSYPNDRNHVVVETDLIFFARTYWTEISEHNLGSANPPPRRSSRSNYQGRGIKSCRFPSRGSFRCPIGRIRRAASVVR